MSSEGVTFQIASHAAEPVRTWAPHVAQDLEEPLVSGLKEYKQDKCGRILQATPVTPTSFKPSSNGFVRGVVDAYCSHHNLLIRPDDVWLAIIIQFSFFVNANAEALRSLFVAHHGKKELVVKQMASLNTANYGLLACHMASELRRNLKDSGFCDWVLPRFSTTTHNDTIVGSVALMATMKHYFDYKFCLCCGIPQVTLAGSVEDWEEIHSRVDKLEVGGYGKVCSMWASMLKKITGQLIRTSRNEIDLEFWSQICHYTSGGSGPRYLSGWITAFCVFDGKGNWQATNFSIPVRHMRNPINPPVLEFPVIDTNDIPPGYITVDVTVDDNGREYKTLMFAGHMGYDIVHQGKGIAPKLAWAMALKTPGK